MRIFGETTPFRMLASLRSLRVGLGLALFSLPALAQQPASAPAPPVLSTAPPASPAAEPGEVIGQTYTVEVASGTSVIGVLTAVSAEELTFQTKDLGVLVIKRTNLKQLSLMTPEQARRGYDYQGNGNRLFFAPTARNLRRGEGTVQTIDIFLLGVNYGITDNISMGALFTWVPAAGADNLFALTPKVSFPVNERVRLGGGGLLFFQQGTNFTLAYGNATYGSADNNLTAGVGYAFVGGKYVNTPVFMLGGATRVSRRISLLNETYILNIKDSYENATFVGGIAGVRVSGQRLSGSLGMMYGFYSYTNRRYAGDNSGDGGAYPFAEATYRFGRVK